MRFESGSMAAKVEAACRFFAAPGGVAAIGALRDTVALVRGEAGTGSPQVGTVTMMVQAAPDPTAPASTPRDASLAESQELELSAAATLGVADVLDKLGSSDAGLSSAEASRRLGIYGPNVLAAHGVSAWSVLVRQLRSYLLLLLLVAAVVSAVVGDLTEALIIGAIMAMSIGLSFFNEYRSEKAVEELHSEIKHLAAVDRDGAPAEIAVTQLVPGDVVHLKVGDVIPADLRVLEVRELECDESVLTGESRASEKTAEARQPGDSPLDLRSCVFMGTLVSDGGGRGVVVRTGSRTAFGAIAVRLGERQGVTAFQQGLQDFSRLLATVTAVLAGSIFVINVALGRSLLQSALFALAIAVGLTPQLLPAIVTVSLATGARRLAKKRVIVKRLVAIEDLGNVEVLFTDKTGTLTQGQITFAQALDASGQAATTRVRVLGLTCSDKTGNELDRALWAAPQDARGGAVSTRARPPALRPRAALASVLADTRQGRLLIAKGAPEAVLARCTTVPPRHRRCSTASSPRGRGSSRSPAAGRRRPPRHGRRARPLPRRVPLLRRPGQARRQGRRSPGSPGSGSPSRSSPATTAIVAAKVCRDIGLDSGGTSPAGARHARRRRSSSRR